MRIGLPCILLCLVYSLCTANIKQSKAGFDPKFSIHDLVMDHWTYKSGLSSNNVNAIYQSEDGFIWITSYSGLQRFDGVNFKQFNTNNVPLLKSNTAYRVYEDSEDNHWFTTRNGGIIGYKEGKFHEYEGNDSIPSDIFAFLQAENGDFWIGTGNSGVFRKKINGPWERIEELMNYRVLSIVEDEKKNIWIGTQGEGLFLHNDQGVTQYGVEDGLPTNVILQVNSGKDGKVYISTTSGLSYWQNEQFRRFDFLDGYEINEVIEDDYGTIWVATGKGLVRLNEELGISEIFSTMDGLPGMRLSGLCFDHEGSLWVGTYNTGLVRFRIGQVKNITTRNGLSSNRINIINKIDGKIFVGTEDGNINYVQNKSITQIFKEKLPINVAIRDILLDKKGDVWIGSYNGIMRVNGNQYKSYTEENGLTSNEVRRLMETTKGDIWVGTRSGGLMKFESSGDHVVFDKDHGLGSNYILAIEEDKNGNVVVGTSGGGLVIIDDQLQLNTFHPTGEDSGILIFNVHIDDDNIFWLCTNLGLFYFDGQSFVKIKLTPTLNIDRFFDMLDDGIGGVWLTSDIGIFRIEKADLNKYVSGQLEGVRYTEFNEQDGLLTRECTGATRSFIDEETGQLWIPTWEGLAIIDPSAPVPNNEVPNIFITSAIVDGNSLDVYDTDNRINPGAFRYRFNFTSLSYLTPSRVEFKYKLEGIDDDWKGPVHQRSVEYTNLPFGEYTFRVIGSNGQNLWNEEGAALSFEVLPYVYERAWFQLGVLGILLLIIYLVYRWRVREIKQRNVALVKINRELDSFVYRASHDLRTPVTSTMGLVNIGLQENSVQHKNEYFKLIDQCARKLDHIILDIIEYSKNKNEAVEYSVFSIKELIDDILNDLKFIGDLEKIEFKTNIESEHIYSDRNRIKVILSSLIMNAIQYRDSEKSTTTIQIDVCKDKNTTRLRVSDNGIGINGQESGKIFDMFYRGHHKSSGSGLGLYIVNEAAKKLQGMIKLESEPGIGSTFELVIPHGVSK